MKSKKILVVFIFLILLSILFSVKVFAVVEYIDRTTGFHFKVVGNEITITGVENDVKIANIPSTIDGKNVTTIGSYAFFGRNDMLKITIPETVENIEGWAFRGCENITEIKLPNNLKSIGLYGFAECKSLKEIEIPYNLKGNSIFIDCTKLEKVLFTSNVTKIEWEGNFENCNNLKEIHIPSSVTEISMWQETINNSNFTVYGDYNSYAKQYCEEKGINFVATRGQPEEEQKPNEEEQKPKEEENPKDEEQPQKEQKPSDEKQPQEEQRPSDEEQPQKPQPTESKPQQKEDKTIVSGSLPKAGLKYGIMPIIILIVIVSVFFYKKHSNLKDIK